MQFPSHHCLSGELLTSFYLSKCRIFSGKKDCAAWLLATGNKATSADIRKIILYFPIVIVFNRPTGNLWAVWGFRRRFAETFFYTFKLHKGLGILGSLGNALLMPRFPIHLDPSQVTTVARKLDLHLS